eukprot:gb/GECH01014107.1/.p1 GENE.gb/GECH01014107.1/~~gb/GECH01014107.1/.p1  ORF type:complete len:357 (+),score=86.70 gb/GECH01014107.1/:1-1071(+)
MPPCRWNVPGRNTVSFSSSLQHQQNWFTSSFIKREFNTQIMNRNHNFSLFNNQRQQKQQQKILQTQQQMMATHPREYSSSSSSFKSHKKSSKKFSKKKPKHSKEGNTVHVKNNIMEAVAPEFSSRGKKSSSGFLLPEDDQKGQVPPLDSKEEEMFDRVQKPVTFGVSSTNKGPIPANYDPESWPYAFTPRELLEFWWCSASPYHDVAERLYERPLLLPDGSEEGVAARREVDPAKKEVSIKDRTTIKNDMGDQSFFELVDQVDVSTLPQRDTGEPGELADEDTKAPKGRGYVLQLVLRGHATGVSPMTMDYHPSPTVRKARENSALLGLSAFRLTDQLDALEEEIQRIRKEEEEAF